MGTSYRQFCPVAKAMELLDERWTLLIVRELVMGTEHFNELRRGVPRMSPTLLSKRLGQLERAGVVERTEDGRYLLTAAGQELRPVVEALGLWGTRWIGELGDQDLDPKLLMWDMHRNVDRAAIPAGRTVVGFRFPDAPMGSRNWWLVITADETDICDVDPGHDVAVTVTSTLRALTQVWRGDRTWTDVLGTAEMTLDGPGELRRALPAWFTLMPFARVPRPVGPAIAAPVGVYASADS